MLCVRSISIGDTPVGTRIIEATDAAAPMSWLTPGGVSMIMKSAEVSRRSWLLRSRTVAALMTGNPRLPACYDQRTVDCWGSMSKTATSCPLSVRAAARNIAVVVFPVPPLDWMVETICGIRPA